PPTCSAGTYSAGPRPAACLRSPNKHAGRAVTGPSQPGDDARQDVDALRDGLLVDGGVAEDQAAGTRVADPVGCDALDAHPGPGRRVDHGRLVQARWQPG